MTFYYITNIFLSILQTLHEKFDKEHDIVYEGVLDYNIKLKMLGLTTTIEGIDKTSSAHAKIGGK